MGRENYKAYSEALKEKEAEIDIREQLDEVSFLPKTIVRCAQCDKEINLDLDAQTSCAECKKDFCFLQ